MAWFSAKNKKVIIRNIIRAAGLRILGPAVFLLHNCKLKVTVLGKTLVMAVLSLAILLGSFFIYSYFIQDKDQQCQAADQSAALIWDGELAGGCVDSFGVFINTGCFEGTTCFEGHPDGYHQPTLRLGGSTCQSSLPSYRKDFSAYDEIWFYAKSDQIGKTFDFSLSGWPSASNAVNIDPYIEGGQLDTSWRLVRIPTAALKNSNYTISTIELLYFGIAKPAVNPADNHKIYIDSIYAVSLGGINPDAMPLVGPLAPLAFSDTNLGSSSQRTFSLTNTGRADLIVNSFSFSGANASEFSTPTAPMTISAGGSAVVAVNFSPSSSGDKSASLVINHNATPLGNSSTISLSGKAFGPAISVAGSLDLGSVSVGKSSFVTLSISNTGNQDLDITNITSSNSAFSVNPTTATVLPGSSASIIVTFTPTKIDQVSASLIITTNDSLHSQKTVNLTGQGVEASQSGALSLHVGAITSSKVDLNWTNYVGLDKVKIYIGPEPPDTANTSLPLQKLIATLPASDQTYRLTNLSAATDIFIRVENLSGDTVIAANNVHVKTLGGPKANLDTALREVHLVAPDIIELVMTDNMVISYSGDPAYDYSKITGYRGSQWQADSWQVTRNNGSALTVTNIYRNSVPVGNPYYTKSVSPYPHLIQYDKYVNVDHRLYLKLNQKVGNNDILSITGTGPLGFNVIVPYSDKYLETPSIQLNQVGYSPQASKRYAYVSNWLGDGGPMSLANFPATAEVFIEPDNAFSLRTAISNPPITLRSSNDTDAGTPVDEINLAGQNMPEAEATFYRIRIPGVGISWSTQVNNSAVFKAYYTVTRGLYFNRWGRDLKSQWADQFSTRQPDYHKVYVANVSDQKLRSFFPQNTPTTQLINVQGGHHDAGDYDIQYNHYTIPMQLLGTYESNPQAFVDNQLNIPESGNGIPDILDEALYNLKGWQDLQDADGGVRAGVESYAHPPWSYADLDPLAYWTYKKDPGTSMRTAALFAWASRLVAPFDAAKAADLRQRAIKAYDWAVAQGLAPIDQNTLSYVPQGTSMTLFALSQLYRLTGDSQYKTDLQAAMDLAGMPKWNSSRISTYMPYINTGAYIIGNDNSSVQWGYAYDYFMGYMVSPDSLGTTYFQKILNQFDITDNIYINRINDAHAHRNGRPTTQSPDWAAGTAVGQYASGMHYRLELNNVAALSQADRQNLIDAMSLSADYSLGANPNGLVYITGLGSRSLSDPLHNDAIAFYQDGKGLMPGITGFGPVAAIPTHDYYDFASYTFYPQYLQQPLMRRFGDVRSFVTNTEGGANVNAIYAELFGSLLPATGLVPASQMQPLGNDYMNPLAPRYTLTGAANVDTSAPITTAFPNGGSYTASLSVTLLANETATIFYCLGSACTPNLTYSSPINLTTSQTIRFYARNLAGNNESVKTAVYTITAACTENWSCTDWSACADNIQTRICTDANSCGTTTNRPALSQTCISDGTPPVRSNSSVSAITTTSATLSLTTDENATCKYSTTAGTAYASIANTFATTGTIAHLTTVSGLAAGTSYTYYVRCQDTAGNPNAADYGILFNTISLPDAVPPAAVANLSAANIFQTSLILNWTAPGDDGTTGTAISYDIRYSTQTITAQNWATAALASGEPVPLVAGSNQTYTMVGLSPNSIYYFALKTSDEVPNISALSNVISATTPSASITCTAFTYSAWGSCQSNNTQSRTVVTYSPSGCTGGSPVLSQTCVYTPPACTAFTYSAWGSCQSNNTQSRTIVTFLPAGCIGGSPILTNSCTYTVPSGKDGSGLSSDTTPPAAPSQFAGALSGNYITLKWNNPSDLDFIRVLIVRKENSAPTSKADGMVVYEGNLKEFKDTAISQNKTYYYSIYAYDSKPNYSQPSIISVSASLDLIPNQITGSLVKLADSPKVYLIANGKKRYIPSYSVFLVNNFSWSGIKTISQNDLDNYTSDDDVSYPNGTLLKSPDNSAVYLYENGKRKVFFNAKYFLSNGYSWNNIYKIPQEELNQFLLSANTKYPDGTLVKGLAPMVYVIQDGQRRPIKTGEVFEGLGLHWSNIIVVSDFELTFYPEGQEITKTADLPTNFIKSLDSDSDTIYDYLEKIYGTDPNKKDTDGDGYDDWTEIRTGHNPLGR